VVVRILLPGAVPVSLGRKDVKRKKVLLVDDVRLFLEMAKSFLSRESLQPTFATDGREALKVMRASRPDLVVMDLHMPKLDGASACREIKQDPVLGNVPVVLLAARGRQDEADLCRESGCDALLEKPLRRVQLLETVRRFLDVAERATPRLETRMLVRYGTGREMLLHDYSLNLGVGGLFLVTKEPVPVTSRLKLEFLVPGGEIPVRCEGEVAWVNPTASTVNPGLPAGLGIRFTSLGAADEEQLRNFLRRERMPPRQ